MKVTFSSEGEKTEVLFDLRTLKTQFLTGARLSENGACIGNGLRVSSFEKAIACVESIPVEPNRR